MRAAAFHESRHLAATELTASARCPVCGGEDRRRVTLIQREPEVWLLACRTCGLASASHSPTSAALEDYYSRYYQQNELGVTFVGKGAFARNIAKRITPRRILDFGGGDGSLAKAISPTAEIVVVDYSAPRGDPRVMPLRELSEATGQFDLVVASAVLEHVPDLRPTMERLFKLVAPGGLFYARTPYIQPFAALLNVDLGFPGHVHDMGPDFWNRVVETFQLDATLEASRPSIVETTFASHPLRTLAAYALKAPCHLELKLHRDPWWRFVGGWEVFLRFR